MPPCSSCARMVSEIGANMGVTGLRAGRHRRGEALGQVCAAVVKRQPQHVANQLRITPYKPAKLWAVSRAATHAPGLHTPVLL